MTSWKYLQKQSAPFGEKGVHGLVEICGFFNRPAENQCAFKWCRYAHICAQCRKGPHPAAECTRFTGGTKPGRPCCTPSPRWSSGTQHNIHIATPNSLNWMGVAQMQHTCCSIYPATNRTYCHIYPCFIICIPAAAISSIIILLGCWCHMLLPHLWPVFIWLSYSYYAILAVMCCWHIDFFWKNFSSSP